MGRTMGNRSSKYWVFLVSAALVFGVAACTSEVVPPTGTPKLAYAPEPGGLSPMFACLRGKTTLVSAHRGGVGPGYPENALETIAHTLSAAPMLIEVDIRTTKDGQLILMHDETLERTTTGAGSVADTDWATIRKLKLRDPEGAVTRFSPPSLVEALQWMKGKGVLLLDIKAGTRVESVMGVVKAVEAQDRVVLIVYTAEGAGAVHRIDPTLMVSAGINGYRSLQQLQDAGARANNLLAWTGTEDFDPELASWLRLEGISVSHGVFWTLDLEVEESGNEALYAELAAQGLDVLATDRHLQAYQALQANGSTEDALRACAITPSPE